MADVDISSYPKPMQAPSALDTLGKLQTLKQQEQGIERTGIGIEADKLALMNSRYGILNKELSSLIGKQNLSSDDIVTTGQNLVKLGIIPADMFGKFVSQIPTKQQLQQNPNAAQEFIQQTIDRSRHVNDAVNFHYGVPGFVGNNQTQTPVVTSNKPGFGVRPTGAPIQMQLPPGQEVATPRGTQLLGPQEPRLPAGARPLPSGLPGQYQPQGSPVMPAAPANRLPVAPVNTAPIPPGPVTNSAVMGPSRNFRGNVTKVEIEPPSPQVPAGPMTSQAPLFEEGKKLYTADQDVSTQKLTQIKPVVAALPIIESIRSGPGTEAFTKAVAGLKTWGLISTAAENDPTALYQEASKKLAQYVSQSGLAQRSDAAQTLAEAASPNPKTQISPALIKLTKDAIIYDRIQAMRSVAFQGNDYSKYGAHRATFPSTIDSKAVGLDLMKPEDRYKLIDEMKKKKNTPEGKKFWKSLELVHPVLEQQ